MKARLYAELAKAIDQWMDRECDSEEWPDMITGHRTAELMARAAQSVFDAVEEAQVYAKREGYLRNSA